MSLSLGIALYFIIWWVVLFAVLPFGLKTQDESGAVVPGTPGSAPARSRMIRVFAINTVVAALVFIVVWAAITFELVSLVTATPPKF